MLTLKKLILCTSLLGCGVSSQADQPLTEHLNESLVDDPPSPTQSPNTPKKKNKKLPPPDFFLTDGPPQMRIPPEQWAITLAQLKQVMHHICSTDKYQKLKASKGTVNMYMINDEWFVPWTANTGRSVALHLNPNGLRAQAMASHAWAEDCEELLDALDGFQRLHNLPDDFGIWVCTFAQYQPKKSEDVDDVGPSITEQLALDPFTKVLNSAGVREGRGLVAVHTCLVCLYSRLWCPFEMNQATVEKIEVAAAASQQYVAKLQHTHTYFVQKICQGRDADKAFEMFAKRELKVNTKRAKCSTKDDQDRITEQIEEDGGFELLDDIIFEIRKTLVQAIMAQAEQQELSQQKAKAWYDLGCAGGGTLDGETLSRKQCYERALQLDPDPSKAQSWHCLGFTGGGELAGETLSEKQCYVRALECDPKHANAWNGLGAEGGGTVQGETLSAKQCYERARQG